MTKQLVVTHHYQVSFVTKIDAQSTKLCSLHVYGEIHEEEVQWCTSSWHLLRVSPIFKVW